MITSKSSVSTANASRYLQQLSKHWSHKFDVNYTATNSTIPFSEDRTAELVAEDDRLWITLTVPDEESRVRMQKVIEDHLNRFAFKETLAYDWTAQPA
ncbi:DUF2218 domain-containing protein [Microvirga puerhi]|uniref:DUF2218 domain-containing protein n=1 Tax=Microvirga puerhi TaxID=2876078 RepID=A0ABS7VP09_9HYPH|nr:DUF2218 domain-containing protein [Microvirga puerhi]